MPLLSILFFICVLLLGIYMGFVSLKDSKSHFLSIDKVDFSKVLLNSIQFGISISMIMFGGMYALSYIFEPERQNTFKDFVLAAILFLGVGGVVFLGSLWQYFMVGKYKNWLMDKLKNKNKKS